MCKIIEKKTYFIRLSFKLTGSFEIYIIYMYKYNMIHVHILCRSKYQLNKHWSSSLLSFIAKIIFKYINKFKKIKYSQAV